MIARVGHVDPRRYHLILNSSQVNSREQGVSRLISFFFLWEISQEKTFLLLLLRASLPLPTTGAKFK